jgi:hypothetical protein
LFSVDSLAEPLVLTGLNGDGQRLSADSSP